MGMRSSAMRSGYICFGKEKCFDSISIYRGTKKLLFLLLWRKENPSLDVHCNVYLPWKSQTQSNRKHVTLCSWAKGGKKKKRWMVVEKISNFIQTGYTAKRKDDHLNPLDDKTSASGVRRKSPSCWNVLSTWEQGAGQLCKWWKDGLTEQLHCDEVTSDSQMLLSATVTLTMLMWGVGDAWAAEAEQEMIRNTGGKNPCWAYLADFFERKALWATSLSRTRGEQHLLRFTFVVGDITGASRARKGLASNILKLYLQTIFVIRFKLCLRCEVVLGGSLVK